MHQPGTDQWSAAWGRVATQHHVAQGSVAASPPLLCLSARVDNTATPVFECARGRAYACAHCLVERGVGRVCRVTARTHVHQRASGDHVTPRPQPCHPAHAQQTGGRRPRSAGWHHLVRVVLLGRQPADVLDPARRRPRPPAETPLGRNNRLHPGHLSVVLDKPGWIRDQGSEIRDPESGTSAEHHRHVSGAAPLFTSPHRHTPPDTTATFSFSFVVPRFAWAWAWGWHGAMRARLVGWTGLPAGASPRRGSSPAEPGARGAGQRPRGISPRRPRASPCCVCVCVCVREGGWGGRAFWLSAKKSQRTHRRAKTTPEHGVRSEERRGGKECVR